MLSRASRRGTRQPTPAPAPAATPTPAPAAPPAPASLGAITDATESAVPRVVGAVAIVLPAGLLVQALISQAGYRHPVVPVVVWLGMLAAAVWLVPEARSGHLGPAQAGAGVLVAVAAVTAIGLDRKAGSAGVITLDWTILGTVWLLALIALSCPARLWVPGSALVLGVQAIFILSALGTSPLGLSRLAASAYVVASILAVFPALRPALRAQAELAMRRSALASRSAAERAAATAIAEVRRGRLGLMEAETLPLLRAIAGHALDPSDDAVRRQCAQQAETLRQALADRRLPGEAGLLADLEPVLSAARTRDVTVEVQVIGDPGRPGPDVVDATRAAADGVLRALPPQPAMLTVLATRDQVELYLTFERALAAGDVPGLRRDVSGLRRAVRADAAWRAILDVEDSGPGCLEVTWRTAGLLGHGQ